MRHAGLLERERIGDGDVAGNVNEENGIFRADGVELLARGKFFVGPESVVPTGADDPVAFFVSGDGCGDGAFC